MAHWCTTSLVALQAIRGGWCNILCHCSNDRSADSDFDGMLDAQHHVTGTFAEVPGLMAQLGSDTVLLMRCSLSGCGGTVVNGTMPLIAVQNRHRILIRL